MDQMWQSIVVILVAVIGIGLLLANVLWGIIDPVDDEWPDWKDKS